MQITSIKEPPKSSDRLSLSPIGSPGPTSPLSPYAPFSHCTPCTPSESGDDHDTTSIASSASSVSLTKKFKILDTWRPLIMACINAMDDEENRRRLTSDVRNYIVRDLVTTMFSYVPKPSKEFCTLVAKRLVQKYKFMMDTGTNVSGYVSNVAA